MGEKPMENHGKPIEHVVKCGEKNMENCETY